MTKAQTHEGATTREAVRRLATRGIPVREIALELELSTQAVYQHVAVLAAAEGFSGSRSYLASFKKKRASAKRTDAA